MSAHRQILNMLIAGVMLLGSNPLWSNPETVLTPFSAEYHLSRDNMAVGKVIITLELDQSGLYRYRAYTVATGLASLFRDDQITEQSQGTIENGAVIPDNYLYHHRRRENPRKVTVDFNWRTGNVTNHSSGKRWTMTIPTGTQDKFSQQLALMIAMAKEKSRVDFKVADGGRLKSYRFSADGREPVETGTGTITALKVKRKKDNRPSDSTIWLAPDLNYLPVKITKQKKDEQVIMLLQSVSWN
ncbi:DUF3108 domain-containing protein [Solemya velesiana gill symbiont]|uniref:DUF3108 domain-containing protein n=1 Tax=Solemya velesiana gill symbiont TaxID=1918948 RepID=A0A1T2KPJ9_9GAMM|nr:DUF3108 domain-containing protein [Solemya velesiana gill symbiont]OOZ34765.1 hypothetical protein BOW51_11880 [Solemya velesiana gill symbiont]